MKKRKAYQYDPEYQADVLDGLLQGNSYLSSLADDSKKRLDAQYDEIKENREKIGKHDSDIGVLKDRVQKLEESSTQKLVGMVCILAGLYAIATDINTGYPRRVEVLAALTAIIFGVYQCSPNKKKTSRDLTKAVKTVGAFASLDRSSDNDQQDEHKASKSCLIL